MLASPLLIPGKSRMRKRACTDLCGGRSAMVVPTATVILGRYLLAGEIEIFGEFPDHAQNTTSQIIQVPRSPAYRNVAAEIILTLAHPLPPLHYLQNR